MIQIDRETFQMMLHQIMERFDKIEDRLNRMNRQTSALDGDKLLDNQDMCELLGITKRTLARYRQKKLVAYYMIDGRTYYKSSEVEAFLNQKGKRMPAKTGKTRWNNKTEKNMELVCIDKQTFEELRIRFCKFEERMTHICRPVEDLGL